MPSPDEIRIFIEVYRNLIGFEASQRMMRGYGAFTEKEITELQPSVKTVYDWLKTMAGIPEDEECPKV